ncbi:Proteasome activator complex subunit 4 [Homalodisca vitripennis]|nr:Proteasome activator complex subunit 4 [Homalodisca vitripennis]
MTAWLLVSTSALLGEVRWLSASLPLAPLCSTPLPLSRRSRKKELISREELILPWRTIYNICDLLMCSSKSSSLYRYSSYLENSLSELLVAARVYFEPTATQEMLELWRPQLCPLHYVDMQVALELLESFLPTIFLPNETGLGYELWLNEFLQLWQTCHNSPSWEPSMMSLMSRVASHNVGKIDWEPHMALMYTRILRSFSLPVNYKKMKINKYHKLSTTAVTVWIVSTLGGGSSSQKHLDQMMKVLESYFHPANAGTWVSRLKEFFKKLTFYFVQRVYIERHRKPSWLPQIPEKARLTDDDITRFVESTAPAVCLSMYSRVATEVSLSLQHLACLRPALVIPSIIDRCKNE